MSELAPGRRSDARSNHARILEVATEIIAREGTTASLKEIAEAAEVGRGTLYRHFPTREDLLASVLRTWGASVKEAADAAPVATRDELIDWLARFAAISNTYRGLADTMAATMDDDASPLREICAAGHDANGIVLARAREAGLLRAPIDAKTLSRLVTGIAMIAERAQLSAEQVRPLLGVVADGLLARSGGDQPEA